MLTFLILNLIILLMLFTSDLIVLVVFLVQTLITLWLFFLIGLLHRAWTLRTSKSPDSSLEDRTLVLSNFIHLLMVILDV